MSFLKTIKKLRLKTVAIVLGGLFLLYTCIGFLLVPYIAKKYTNNIIQDKFGVQPEIQKIYFNPFNFVVEVTNFKIPDRLELGKLKLDLELFPLFNKQIKLKYIYLGATNLTLAMSGDGRTNWTPNTTKEVKTKAKDAKKSSWQINIDDIALERISTSLILKKGDKSNVKKGTPVKNKEKDTSSPVEILITQLRIIDNQINFVDQKNNPSFKGSLDNLNGVIKPIALASNQKINIDLKGLIGAFGTVGIGGFIIPDSTKPYNRYFIIG